MSILHFDAISAAAADQIVVSLTGSSINATGGFDYDWGWDFLTTGGMKEDHNGTLLTINSDTDWVVPSTFTPADYEVRGQLISESCSQTKSTFGSNAFLGATWYGLGVTRQYRFGIDTNGDNEFCNGSIRFEIKNIVKPSANTITSTNDGVTAIMAEGVYAYQIEIGFE